MIKRIWHGWTTHDNADAYEGVLSKYVFPEIENKRIPGYRGIELLRRNHEAEVEFITIMTFESLDSIVGFQGRDYQRAYVPQRAQDILSRWDKESAHYEVKEVHYYG